MPSSTGDRESPHDVHHPSDAVAVLTCPRCGRVDRMSYRAWAAWTSGIRCGLCGPPYVLMEARIVDDDSGSTYPKT